MLQTNKNGQFQKRKSQQRNKRKKEPNGNFMASSNCHKVNSTAEERGAIFTKFRGKDSVMLQICTQSSVLQENSKFIHIFK